VAVKNRRRYLHNVAISKKKRIATFWTKNIKVMMPAVKIFIFLMAALITSKAQRPFYAGLRPIGFPEIETNDVLLNRFGEDVPGPIEAKGDGNLINRLNKMPIDKRPFWFLNWQAYDDLRKNPQTWPLKPNTFINRN
ncbi:unnamed protein product, partial [Parnassius apollo]